MKTYKAKSIRTFIGAKEYDVSKQFYQDLGFEAIEVSTNMTLFKVHPDLAFYLQDYYIKDWIDNSMVFLEVDHVDRCWKELNELGLHLKYESVRLSPIKTWDWGRECFLHDPSGVLWHFAQFHSK